MKAKDYEARIEASGASDIVLTTSKKIMVLKIEGDDGKYTIACLDEHDVASLIVALTIWQQHKIEGFD